MTKYPCPICNKRVCDSQKILSIKQSSKSNRPKADVLIKCQSCKAELSVKIIKDTFTIEQTSPRGEVIS